MYNFATIKSQGIYIQFKIGYPVSNLLYFEYRWNKFRNRSTPRCNKVCQVRFQIYLWKNFTVDAILAKIEIYIQICAYRLVYTYAYLYHFNCVNFHFSNYPPHTTVEVAAWYLNGVLHETDIFLELYVQYGLRNYLIRYQFPCNRIFISIRN